MAIPPQSPLQHTVNKKKHDVVIGVLCHQVDRPGLSGDNSCTHHVHIGTTHTSPPSRAEMLTVAGLRLQVVRVHGHWAPKFSFPTRNTIRDIFTCGDGHRASCYMMRLKAADIRHIRCASFQAVALPFGPSGGYTITSHITSARFDSGILCKCHPCEPTTGMALASG